MNKPRFNKLLMVFRIMFINNWLRRQDYKLKQLQKNEGYQPVILHVAGVMFDKRFRNVVRLKRSWRHTWIPEMIP